MNRALHLLADDPIFESRDDKLNRWGFARQIVEVIQRLPAKESSTVLALIGPWGSGKSSLLGLVTHFLETSHSDEWKVVAFNPWEVSSLDGLMIGFFEAISSAIPDDFQTKTAGETLQSYASKLLSLGGAFKVPSAILANAMGFLDPGKLAETLGKLLDSKASTQKLKKRLEVALADLPQRILVVIDDLDRLMPDELLMVFKLIRLLGRLPGIHYLLAYDEQTLLSVLKESQLARGSPDRALAYLEKIVQVRLDLPIVHRVQADEMIQSCVEDLLSGLRKPITDQEKARLQALLKSDLLMRLNEPRSIKRFFAQVAAYLPLVMHRVDLPDFVALSYVRTFYPLLYRELHRRKWELLTNKGPTDSMGKQLHWPGIATSAGVPESEATTIVKLIAAVFPAGSFSTSGGELLGGTTERRAADTHYFERYFYFGVPPGDVAEDEIEKVFSTLGRAGTEAERARLEGWLRESFDLVLPKLKALEPGLDALQRAHLLIVLARRYRAAHESGEDLLQRTDFRDLSLHLLVVLSEGATELVSLALTDSMEIRFLFGLMKLRVRLPESGRQGGRELLLRIAHRVPEILAAMTNQELPRVQWCIAMAATWAEVEGRKRVHDWMVAELERAESSWRVEDLLGCCVVGVKPVSGGYQVGEFFTLDTMTLEAVVPRGWLLEKLKDRIQNATETVLQDTHRQVPFAALISYGLWRLHESINDDKEEVARLAGAPDERGDAG